MGAEERPETPRLDGAPGSTATPGPRGAVRARNENPMVVGGARGYEETRNGSGPAFDPRAWASRAIPLVESFEDAQRVRIALENRVRSVEQGAGEEAVPPGLQAAVDAQRAVEHSLELEIRRVWRSHPLAPWARDVRGLGEHTACIILALLGGDPLTAHPKRWVNTPGGAHLRELVDDPPFRRSVSQLWQYCGVGAPGKRQRGMTQEEALALGNPRLKMRVLFGVAEGMLKAGNRSVYDEAKAAVSDREGWTDGHKHRHALRIVGKRFLQELYDASKDAVGTDPATRPV